MDSDLKFDKYKDLVHLSHLIADLEIWNPGGEHPQIVAPEGFQVLTLASKANAPDRIRATPTFWDVDSLVAYAQRFGAGEGDFEGVVFGDRSTRKVTAILDYPTAEGPDWAQHRATLTMRHTPEWMTWTSNDKKHFEQEAFANLLEKLAPDIVEPDGATLMDVALSLEAKTGVAFKSAFTQKNGMKTLQYSETMEAAAGPTGSLKVPDKLVLAVKIFEGDEQPSRAEAFFRFRVTNGKLILFYELIRPERVIEAAFEEVLKAVSTGLSLPMLHGAPGGAA